jgi:O-ureido-D-serine cyclo-ligase
VRVALVTAAPARDLDDDLPPLAAALGRFGACVDVVDWDDPRADWSGFDLALVRSTWDYHGRYDEFRTWIERAGARTALHNPPEVLVWNTDKRYLRDLAAAGLPVVPTTFLDPDDPGAVDADGSVLGDAGEVVVKPAVSAGARNTARYLLDEPAERARAAEHARALVGAGRVVMVQPYLASVDTRGETAVVVVDGAISHALRKGPLLHRGAESDDALFAWEDMSARDASVAEAAVAEAVVTHLAARFGRAPLYARVDLLAGEDGEPVVLELELTEPSLFFTHAPDAVERFARAALARAR